MREETIRTEMLLGDEAMEKLQKSTIAVFGVGGVGGYVTEALARAGIGHLILIDRDTVSVSNINRQMIALHSTVGQPKVEVMKRRILDINPDAVVETRQCFYLPENADTFDFSEYTYVVDAVDTVTAKLTLVERATEAGVPIISSMGAGNKLHPELFEIADIYKTSVCPLAKVMRKECKARGIKKLKVVYSKELARKPAFEEKEEGRRSTPGSISFVPSAAGLILAGEVIREITGIQ